MIGRLLLGVALVGLLASGGGPAGAQESRGAQPQHVVDEVVGELRVQREGTREFVPAIHGMPVGSRDLLQLLEPSTATVTCSNLERVEVQSGNIRRVPCPDVGVVRASGEALVTGPRGNGLGAFPTVVSPRRTNLLSPRPALRWTTVRGAPGYEVSLRAARGPVLWRRRVGPQGELAYPDGEPALVAGGEYGLTVAAGGRASFEEGLPDLGFTVLSDEQADEVRELEQKVTGLGLAEPMTDYMVARLYASDQFKLYAEAIERLEALGEVEEPRVLLFLGDLYVRVALNRLAEERYLRAAELAVDRGDIDGEAAAHDQLGKVYDALGNAGEAAERSGRALEIYRSLGDARKVAEIEDRLAGVSRP